jgi:hypothetical protein
LHADEVAAIDGRECRVGLPPFGNCFVADWPRRRDEEK